MFLLTSVVWFLAAEPPPRLAELISAKHAFGATLGIDDGGRQTFHAVGEAKTGTPMKTDAVFEIGSITKVFTSLLLAEMAARGEVRLDDPVAALLPAGTVVPERDGKKITLALLASHHSGLPRLPDLGFWALLGSDPYAKFDGAAMLKGLPKTTLEHAPGAKYGYSNYGAGLLGYALARKLDLPFETALRNRVLAPLGLKEAAIALPPALKARFVEGHGALRTSAGAWNFDALAGAGALRAPAANVLRLLRWQYEDLDPTIPASLRTALATVRKPRHRLSPRQQVGLGWHWNGVADDGPGVILWHNGGTGGYCAMACCIPETKTATVILANSTPNGKVDGAAMGILMELPANARLKPAGK